MLRHMWGRQLLQTVSARFKNKHNYRKNVLVKPRFDKWANTSTIKFETKPNNKTEYK